MQRDRIFEFASRVKRKAAQYQLACRRQILVEIKFVIFAYRVHSFARQRSPEHDANDKPENQRQPKKGILTKEGNSTPHALQSFHTARRTCEDFVLPGVFPPDS